MSRRRRRATPACRRPRATRRTGRRGSGAPARAGAASVGAAGGGGRWPAAGRDARSARDRQGRRVRPLSGGVGRGRPGPARPLRQGRAAAGAPRRHRVERYLGRCPCCGGATLAPVPEGMEEGSPFGVSILALALYLRFTHAISYRRLTRLLLHLFALPISEGALDGLFRRAKPRFEDEAAAILARLRRARVVCSDETAVRVDGRTWWDWVFRNDEVAIHVIRPSRGRAVVAEVLGGRRPAIWVSDLYGAQRGHADLWQVRLAHQLRDLG